MRHKVSLGWFCCLVLIPVPLTARSSTYSHFSRIYSHHSYSGRAYGSRSYRSRNYSSHSSSRIYSHHSYSGRSYGSAIATAAIRATAPAESLRVLQIRTSVIRLRPHKAEDMERPARTLTNGTTLLLRISCRTARAGTATAGSSEAKPPKMPLSTVGRALRRARAAEAVRAMSSTTSSRWNVAGPMIPATCNGRPWPTPRRRISGKARDVGDLAGRRGRVAGQGERAPFGRVNPFTCLPRTSVRGYNMPPLSGLDSPAPNLSPHPTTLSKPTG